MKRGANDRSRGSVARRRAETTDQSTGGDGATLYYNEPTVWVMEVMLRWAMYEAFEEGIANASLLGEQVRLTDRRRVCTGGRKSSLWTQPGADGRWRGWR